MKQILLEDEEIKERFLVHFAKQYGEEAAEELLGQLPECNYAKAIAKAQLKKIVEWVKSYEVGEYYHPDKWKRQFDIPREDWQALLKETE